MTRELKLALIVGFSLVLFVTVLVSDHLSRARRAELPQVVQPASLTAVPPSTELRATHEPVRAPAPVTPKPAPSIDSGSPFGAPSGSQIAGAQPTAPAHPNTNPNAGAAPAPNSDTYAMGPLGQAVERGERGVLASEGAQLDNPVVIDQNPRRDGRMDIKLVNNGTTIVPPPITPDKQPQAEKPVAPVTKIPEYAVEEGDTLYDLSKKFYKDPKHWKALQAYNKGRLGKDGSPRAGASILVPPIDVLLGKPATPVTEVAAGANPPVPTLPALAKSDVKTDAKQDAKSAQAKAKTYKVQKDDTMTSIAQRMLGSHRRVNDLIKANPSIDPENMKVGTELRIPA